MEKVQKEILAKAKKLGYITFDQFHRELMRDKKFRDVWEAGAAERAIRSAIIRKRIEKKLSQAQVAKKAKMHQSAIARFESSDISPTLETASRILAAVGAKVHIS
ncbi:MAG: helix-turn-helix transcriptional regulator [bacterium]|nr:helix-turn-helix transcriptional regulator [bacterium]